MAQSKSPLTPSSGTAGFFQQPPKLPNQFEEDPLLRRILSLYVPASSPTYANIQADISPFATQILSHETFALVDDAERNPPSISTHTTFGAPRTTLRTSWGWKALSRIGIEAGMVALGHEARPASEDGAPVPGAARLHHFLKYHVWTGSCATVTCPSAMTDGAAKLLRAHAARASADPVCRRVLAEAYARLTARDVERAWTSGQWMTERTGGSDVRGTETVARLLAEGERGDGRDEAGFPLGPWAIDGFKWFSSATDSSMTVMLARTDKGISAFFAPMRRRNAVTGEAEFNGVQIQRLKPKLGTRPVPTAELVLSGMRGWLLGEEGEGIKEIATILNITRVHTSISALGLWGRGLAISRAYAKVRKVEGRLLMDNETHLRTTVSNHVNYAGHMHLGFFTATLLGISERPESFQSASAEAKRYSTVSSLAQANALLRLLTPVAKGQCSKQGIYGLQECTESIGGVGYLEDEQEYNIARLYRDNSVNSIWEGTTDVIASDVVRVMKGKQGEETRQHLNAWVDSRIKGWSKEWSHAEELVRAELGKLEEWWVTKDRKELSFLGRDILQLLAWVVGTVLLIEDSTRDGNEISKQIAYRWILAIGSDARALEQHQTSWEETSAWNRKILFGDAASSPTAKL